MWHSLHNDEIRMVSAPTDGVFILATNEEMENLVEGELYVMPTTHMDIETSEIVDNKLLFAIVDKQLQQVPHSYLDAHDTSGAHLWHVPLNERDYHRSPQKALWRVARELKMEEYKNINTVCLSWFQSQVSIN